MSKDNLSSIPENFDFLMASYDGSEFIIISGLLKSHGIDVYVESEEGAATREMNAPIPQYNIFVNKQFIDDARKLIDTPHESIEDNEFRDYKQKEKERGIFWGRVLPISFAVFLYMLSSLPMKESDKSMQYFLIGSSLLCVLLFIFSLRKR